MISSTKLSKKERREELDTKICVASHLKKKNDVKCKENRFIECKEY